MRGERRGLVEGERRGLVEGENVNAVEEIFIAKRLNPVLKGFRMIKNLT